MQRASATLRRPMKSLGLVFLGGGIGASLRHLFGGAVGRLPTSKIERLSEDL